MEGAIQHWNYKGMRSVRWWYSYLFVLFFTLSVQYKPDNAEAVRPLHSFGLVFLFFVFLAMSLVRRAACLDFVRLIRGAGVSIFLLILMYIFFSAAVAGERQFKDALYFLYWYLLFFALFGGMVFNMITPFDLSVLVSKVILTFAFLSGLVAILVFMGVLQFSVGDYNLKQNLWVAGRIHGYMGEPTSLGGLLGVGILSLVYLRQYSTTGISWVVAVFLSICLLWSGSRNGIVSVAIALCVYCLLGGVSEARSVVKKAGAFIFLGAVLFVAVVLYLDLDMRLVVDALDREDYSAEDQNSRIYIWAKVAEVYFGSSLWEALVGQGFGGIRSAYRAPFNGFLEILVDFGLVGLILYLLSVFIALLVGLKKYLISRSPIYRFGLCLMIYGLTFSLFASLIPASFFNFVAFSFLFGFFLIAVPHGLAVGANQGKVDRMIVRSTSGHEKLIAGL